VLGARYSSEKRGGRNRVVFHDAPTTIFDNVASFDEETFRAFTPRVGVNYQLGESHFLYFSYSKGFKSGGFNPGSYQNTPFDPEKLSAYEAGAKSTFLERRLQTNVAVFHYDYEDLQVQDVQNNNVIIRNAAGARVTGVELDAVFQPVEALTLDGSFTWLDAEFTSGALLDPKFPALGVQALDGNSLPKAPRYKLALGAQYGVDLDSLGSLTLRGDYAWQDAIEYSAFNVPDLREDAYGWGKVRLTYRTPSERWSVSAFVDNLGDERVSTNKIYTGDIIGSSVMGNLAPPRTFGIELSVSN
jgi:iron complex outermembrane receptor protein